MLHHVLQHSVSDIADEKVMLRVAIRKERSEGIRVISYQALEEVVKFQTTKSNFLTRNTDSNTYITPSLSG